MMISKYGSLIILFIVLFSTFRFIISFLIRSLFESSFDAIKAFSEYETANDINDLFFIINLFYKTLFENTKGKELKHIYKKYENLYLKELISVLIYLLPLLIILISYLLFKFRLP